MNKRFATFCHLIPVIISLLVIGAHFLRSGNLLLTAVSLLLIMVLGVREPIVARITQLALVLATAEWFHLGYNLVSARIDDGSPWFKLAIILGTVAVLSFISFFMFFSKTLKEMYHLSADTTETLPKTKEPSKIETSTLTSTDDNTQQNLIKAHYHKIFLISLCPLALMLMDYSTGVGMVTLISIGIVNSTLRKKIQAIGGFLSQQEKKRLYRIQSLSLVIGTIVTIAYFSQVMPGIKQPFIFYGMLSALPLVLWAATWFEYLHLGKKVEQG